MYLLNAETEILWELEPTASPYDLADLDLIVIDPLGERTYYTSPIAPGDYVPPTEILPGSVSYLITPIIEGLWKVLLVVGIPSDYAILSKVEMFVFDNTTIVNPIKNTPMGTNGSIEIAKDAVLLTSYATKLIFSGTEFDLTEASGVVTVAISDYPVAPYREVTDLLDALFGAVDDSILTTELRTRIDQVDGVGPTSVNARIGTVDDKVVVLESAVNDPNTGVSANALAVSVMGTWIGTLDDAIVAYAGSTTTFVSNVAGNETAIQEQLVTTNGLSAQYTVKVDNNGYVSGFGLASTLIDATPISEFTIVADKFTIAPTDTNPDLEDGSPFFYTSVELEVGGVLVPPGTYMKSAYIADATITNAKIGNIIQSADNGVSWSIDKDGGIEARSLIIRDAEGNIVLASDNTFSSLIANANIPIGVNLVTGSIGYPIEGNWQDLFGTAAGSCVLTIRDDDVWNPKGYPVLEIVQDNDDWLSSEYAQTNHVRTIAVHAERNYQISALMQCHHCTGAVFATWLDKDKISLSDSIYQSVPAGSYTSGQSLNDFYEHYMFEVAPVDAAFVRISIRKFATDNGETDSTLLVTHIMFTEIGDTQVVPTPWTPGYDISSELSKGTLITGGGITLNSGGSIRSFEKIALATPVPGIYMGWDETEEDYVFSVGDTTNYIKWDGTTLQIAGVISVVDWTDITDDYGLMPADNADITTENLAGKGVNLFIKEYSSFTEYDSLPPFQIGVNTVITLDTTHTKVSEACLKFTASGINSFAYFSTIANNYNIPVDGGKRYIISAWLRMDTANNPATTDQVQLSVARDNDGVHQFATFTLPVDGVFYRYSFVVDLSEQPDTTELIFRLDNDSYNGTAGTNIFIDGIMVEEAHGIVNVSSAYTEINESTREVLTRGTIITGGGITLDSGGALNSWGLYDQNVNTVAGVWLGWNGSNYTFGVGDGNEQYIKYDGSALSIGKEVQIPGVDAFNNKNFYYSTFFDGNSGHYENFSNTQNFEIDNGICQIGASTSDPISSTRYAAKFVKYNGAIQLTAYNERRFKCSCNITYNSTQSKNFFFGVGGGPGYANYGGFGFRLAGAVIFGWVGNSTSGVVETVVLSSYSNLFAVFEARWVPHDGPAFSSGGSVEFYIDGVKKGSTLSPPGTMLQYEYSNNEKIVYYMGGVATTTSVPWQLYFYDWKMLQEAS